MPLKKLSGELDHPVVQYWVAFSVEEQTMPYFYKCHRTVMQLHFFSGMYIFLRLWLVHPQVSTLSEYSEMEMDYDYAMADENLTKLNLIEQNSSV